MDRSARPLPPPTLPEASVAAFEEPSGATVPDNAENVEVTTGWNDQNAEVYIVACTVPTEEDARGFCAGGGIGNYLPLVDEPEGEERAELGIGQDELVEPRMCSSTKDGENVDRRVLFSFPEDGPVPVYARAEASYW